MGTEYNFGELLPGSIRGRVVMSTDPGLRFRRSGEPPIAGVQIDLLDGQGNVIATTLHRCRTASTSSRICVRACTAFASISRRGYFDLDAHVGDRRRHADHYESAGRNRHRLGPSTCTNYDFCEEPPAELSGYVFIDGPAIVSNDPLTPEQIRASATAIARRRHAARRCRARAAQRHDGRIRSGRRWRCPASLRRRPDSRHDRRQRLLPLRRLAGRHVRRGRRFSPTA